MAKGKTGLGKGLSALLPTAEEEKPRTNPSIGHTRLYDFQDRTRPGAVASIDLDLISANPYQPRETFDGEALEQLARSIGQLGIIQPITVRAQADGRYEIIAGERRFRASRLAGLSVIPAFIREADTEAMLEMALVENVQREELNPVEVAQGYQRLIEECDLTQEEVANKVGKSRATITNLLRLLKLPASVQVRLRDGQLSIGHARALVSLDSVEVQTKLADQVVAQGLSVRAVERLVKKWLARDQDAAPPAIQIRTPDRDELVLRSMTDRLRSGLGTKVAIRPSGPGEGGRIEVEYYTNDDLGRLIELMGG
jgi:ParB family transcriptional regulator, chromosome partitioning protein